jgi:hypothetical protein
MAPSPRLFSIAAVLGGGTVVIGSYMSWASVTLLWASDNLSRPASDVWTMRCAGIAMLVSGLASLRHRWQALLATSALGLICVSVAVSAAIEGYVAWQQRDPAGTFSLETGLLLCGASAVACLLVATWGAVQLGRVRLAETRAARSIHTHAEPQISS